MATFVKNDVLLCAKDILGLWFGSIVVERFKVSIHSEL